MQDYSLERQTPIISDKRKCWKIDHVRSSTKFSLEQLFGSIAGKFDVYAGMISVANSRFNNAMVEFWIDVNTLNTGIKRRDEYLKSSRFFKAASFPHMEFKSTRIRKTGVLDFVVEGDLTIRGITKKIFFEIEYAVPIHRYWGTQKVGFNVKGLINRYEFGMKSSRPIEAGGIYIDKWIKIDWDLVFVQS